MDQLYMLEGLLPESQCQNLALTALHVVLTVLYVVLIILYPGVDCLISTQFGGAVQQRGHHRPLGRRKARLRHYYCFHHVILRAGQASLSLSRHH